MNHLFPFSGMDPYTESRHWWPGLHTQLIGKLSTDLLPPLLAPAYYVDAERSLQVAAGWTIPDIPVVQAIPAPPASPAGRGLPMTGPIAACGLSASTNLSRPFHYP